MSNRPERTARRARGVAVLLASLALVLSACAPPAPPVVEASPTPTPTPTPVSASLTVRTLIDLPAETPALEMLDEAKAVANETATKVAYSSGGLRVTGVLRVPEGEGPFPGVVVVHGTSDPETYKSGRALVAEQQALVASGYAVLAVDLRGFADSDPADAAGSLSIDTGFGWMQVLDWGMALDVANALRLLRAGQVEQVDPDRVGLVGHSLGGLLALDAAVIAPEASDIVIGLASAPSDFAQLFSGIGDENAAAVDEFFEGDAAAKAQYLADVSPATFFDRADAPLVMVHGTADGDTLPEWSEQTVSAWAAAGNPAQIVLVDGAGHLFKNHVEEEVGAMLAGLDAVLK